MKKQAAVAIVISVALTAVFYMFLLKPKMSAIAETNTKTEQARQEQQQLENKIRQLQAARRNAPLYLARLDRLERMLPSDPDLPGFIRLMQNAASESSIDLVSIAPAPPVEIANAAGIHSIGVTLNFKAGFRRVEDFLGRLETLERVVQVGSLNLSPSIDPDTQQTVLTGTIGLTMYVVGDGARLGPAKTTVQKPAGQTTGKGKK